MKFKDKDKERQRQIQRSWTRRANWSLLQVHEEVQEHPEEELQDRLPAEVHQATGSELQKWTGAKKLLSYILKRFLCVPTFEIFISKIIFANVSLYVWWQHTAGMPHDVQGGVQTDVQLPTVVQERPAAEVRLQEEVLHQVSRSLLSDQNFFYTFTSFLCLLTLDFRACLLSLFCWRVMYFMENILALFTQTAHVRVFFDSLIAVFWAVLGTANHYFLIKSLWSRKRLVT